MSELLISCRSYFFFLFFFLGLAGTGIVVSWILPVLDSFSYFFFFLSGEAGV